MTGAVRRLRAADRPAVPWKNGGGLTRPVATWPAGAGLDTFEWRVSCATVAEDGPFSRFDGIDRTLAVLDGRLALDGDGRSRVIAAGEPPVSFRGEAAIVGRVLAADAGIAAPVVDLNVMVRRGLWEAEVRWAGLPAVVRSAADELLLFAWGAPVEVAVPGDAPVELAPDDVLWISQPAAAPVQLTAAAGRVLVIELSARAAAG